jgi:hypothetical protein
MRAIAAVIRSHWRVAIEALFVPGGVAGFLLVLSVVGAHYHPAANAWQVAAVGLLTLGLGVLLSWPFRPPRRASAGLFLQNRRPRVWSGALPALAGACLMLLWFGVEWPDADPPSGMPIIVRRGDPRFAPASDATAAPSWLVSWSDGSPKEVAVEASDLIRDLAAEASPSERVFRPTPAESARLSWLTVERDRWPMRLPPAAWPVPADTRARLAARAGPTVAGADSPWDVRLLLVNPAPADAFPPDQAADDAKALGDIGLKAVLPEAAYPSGHPLREFQWVVFPHSAGTAPAAPIAPDSYAVLVRTEGGDMEHPGIHRQSPVVRAEYAEGHTVWRLVAPDKQPDLLGETGMLQGPAVLDGVAHAWKSRAASAAVAFAVPTVASRRRLCRAWDLSVDRFVPPATERLFVTPRSTQPFPRNLALTVVALGLLIALARQWISSEF